LFLKKCLSDFSVMTELLHHQLAQHFADRTGPCDTCVYLVHGQEMLVEQSVERVLSHLLGGSDRDLCCQMMPGLAENIPDLLEQMNTFALLAGPKIVLFKDAKLFDARTGQQGLVDQMIDAHAAGNRVQAAKGLLQLCGRLDLDLEAVRQGDYGHSTLKTLHAAVGSGALEQMADHCLTQGWQPLPTQDAVGTLLQAIEKGFPDNHFLIVAVNARVPKNLKFYKALAATGLIVDCNVPIGEGRADKMAQETILRQALEQQLAGAGKTLAPGLFGTLCQLTGFDMRTFSQNVVKLIDYSGERTQITAEDIHHILRRTKSDPIFELTNAVAERNTVQALFYLNTLLQAQWHPLQILAAIANQVRKLLVAKDFAKGKEGRQAWSPGMGYQQFQQAVMPAIQAYDAHNRDKVQQWQCEGHSAPQEKKGTGAAEVSLAPNPKSAYPVYQTLLKSEKYTLQELVTAMALISQSDVRLKSTGQDPALVIKSAIAHICGAGRNGSHYEKERP
jgi:DNA polymerase III subunit delta